jgi:hypothetical protein
MKKWRLRSRKLSLMAEGIRRAEHGTPSTRKIRHNLFVLCRIGSTHCNFGTANISMFAYERFIDI